MNQSEELQCIYLTLRRLRFVRALNETTSLLTEAKKTTASTSNNTLHLFPRQFLFKLLEDKLVYLNERATNVCNDLFRQIGGKVKRIDEQLLQQVAAEERQQQQQQQQQLSVDKQIDLEATIKLNSNEPSPIRYPELDEYFHHCLYHLHDFLIDFDWHEPNLNEVDKADLDYVVDKLPYINNFIQFQRNLDNLTLKATNTMTLLSARQPARGTDYFVQTAKRLDGTVYSPFRKTISPSGQKKRVRFVESPLSSTTVKPALASTSADSGSQLASIAFDSDFDARLQEVLQQDVRDNHSVYAADLLIYSLNLFIQRLSDRLVDWSAQFHTSLDSSLNTLLESKQRVRTAQLRSIVKRLKIYNDVHLTVLDYITEIRQTYLIKCMATTLISRDSERVQIYVKQPRLNVYIERLSQDVESKLILRLTRQCLRILLDLIVGELNLDQIQGQQTRNDENILNFIINWLNVEDVIFGFTGPKRAQKETSPKRNVAKVGSNLSLSAQFKSSSRILNQMENLGELMRVLSKSIVNRLRNQQQIRYFLETFWCGLDRAFDILSQKLSIHNMDSIAAKIRCLTFIYIMGSLEKVLIEEALRNRIELNVKKFESKLANFSKLYMRIPMNEIIPKT